MACAICLFRVSGGDFKAGTGAEEDVLEVRTAAGLGAAPFVDGDDDGGFDAATGDDLRAFREGVVDQFAEAGLGVLELPVN